VSRGDRIGDMGNSGRSTGTHLHYEVRIGGSAKNPMTFIKAGQNVF
jgi:murein DD-endopeptidase MepM/ murein hydrolase activator NlpD